MALSYKIKVYTTLELENCRPNYTKFCTHVVEGHLEGTVSQICDLGLTFYFIKSRKLNYKK